MAQAAATRATRSFPFTSSSFIARRFSEIRSDSDTRTASCKRFTVNFDPVLSLC